MSGQLTDEGYEHEDGTLIELPDEQGRIRVRDQHGNLVHWSDPGDDDYSEYLAAVTPVMKIGIPYAKSEKRHNKWGKVCPVCGKWIETIEKKDFESFSNIEYADHYAAQHSS